MVSAASTVYNAVFMNGIAESGGGKYSGGVENYFRLLEDWGSKTLTFNGSILEMFKSTKNTATRDANAYGVPTRVWSWGNTGAWNNGGKKAPALDGINGPPGTPARDRNQPSKLECCIQLVSV